MASAPCLQDLGFQTLHVGFKGHVPMPSSQVADRGGGRQSRGKIHISKLTAPCGRSEWPPAGQDGGSAILDIQCLQGRTSIRVISPISGTRLQARSMRIRGLVDPGESGGRTRKATEQEDTKLAHHRTDCSPQCFFARVSDQLFSNPFSYRCNKLLGRRQAKPSLYPWCHWCHGCRGSMIGLSHRER